MDFVPLIEAIGEPATALAGGAVLGFVFGFAAQRSRFCTRSAVIEATRRGDLAAFSVWLAGFSLAVLLVQALLHQSLLSVAETRFFATTQSLSGALGGGLLFGIGMALTRGCVSRLVVLAASGNLRAVFGLAVVAVAGYATFAGALVPARDAIAGLWTTATIGGNDILAHLGLGRRTGVAIGGVLLAAALALASRVSAWRFIGGLAVGAAVAAGWWLTYQFSTQFFEPVQVESLSFIRPFATTLMLALGGAYGLDQGLLAGTLAGAFVAAVLFRDFRFAGFGEAGAPSILRYAIGAALMGFGGILAVGCTVGAGLTGGSVLALASLAALLAMMAGAAATDRVVDRRQS